MINTEKLNYMQISELEALCTKLKKGIGQKTSVFKESESHGDYLALRKLEKYYSEVKNVLSHKKRFSLN